MKAIKFQQLFRDRLGRALGEDPVLKRFSPVAEDSFLLLGSDG